MFSFQQSLLTFKEAKTAYNAVYQLTQQDLQARVDNHNTVVRNLARKFGGSMSFTKIYDACNIKFNLDELVSVLPDYTRFEKRTKATRWPYKDNVESTSIPSVLLLNDPMASAVYVRKQIREMQQTIKQENHRKLKEELKKTIEQQQKLATEQEALQKKVAAEQESLDRKIAALTKKTSKKELRSV